MSDDFRGAGSSIIIRVPGPQRLRTFGTLLFLYLLHINCCFIEILAVSTRPPDGAVSALRASVRSIYRFALEFFRFYLHSFISIHQVAPATALLLLLLILLMRAWFIVIR